MCTATSIVAGKQYASFQWEAGYSSGAISEFALLTDLSLQPSVLIENSYFGNNRARGTLIKTSNVLVRNNTYLLRRIYRLESSGKLMDFMTYTHWLE